MSQLQASSPSLMPYFSIIIGVALSVLFCVFFTIFVRYSHNRRLTR